jgi:hypothetical protein
MLKKEVQEPISWLSSKEVAMKLAMTVQQLYLFKKCEYLKPGEHYLDTSLPNSARSTFVWNYEKVVAALAVPAEYR